MGEVIKITREMKEKCYYFAAAIVLSENQFKRFPNEDIIDRIERTFAGKLGEYAFLKYLEQKKLVSSSEKDKILEEMFEIYNGKSNVDSYDFKTKTNKKVDVKTAYKTFHKNLVVNRDQFEDKNNRKDYYVGVKLKLKWNDFINLADYLRDESQIKYPTKIIKTKNSANEYKKVENVKYEKRQVLSIRSVEKCEICGFVSYEDLEKIEYGNLSKADCKYIKLDEINEITDLLKEFKK